MGEYNSVIQYYQRSLSRKLPTIKSLKADVSSASRLSERMEELWVLCVCLWAENRATLLVGIY